MCMVRRMLSMLQDQEKLDKLSIVFCPEELNVAERETIAELEIEHFVEKPFSGELIDVMMEALNISPIPIFDEIDLDQD